MNNGVKQFQMLKCILVMALWQLDDPSSSCKVSSEHAWLYPEIKENKSYNIASADSHWDTSKHVSMIII